MNDVFYRLPETTSKLRCVSSGTHSRDDIQDPLVSGALLATDRHVDDNMFDHGES